MDQARSLREYAELLTREASQKKLAEEEAEKRRRRRDVGRDYSSFCRLERAVTLSRDFSCATDVHAARRRTRHTLILQRPMVSSRPASAVPLHDRDRHFSDELWSSDEKLVYAAHLRDTASSEKQSSAQVTAEDVVWSYCHEKSAECVNSDNDAPSSCTGVTPDANDDRRAAHIPPSLEADVEGELLNKRASWEHWRAPRLLPHWKPVTPPSATNSCEACVPSTMRQREAKDQKNLSFNGGATPRHSPVPFANVDRAESKAIETSQLAAAAQDKALKQKKSRRSPASLHFGVKLIAGVLGDGVDARNVAPSADRARSPCFVNMAREHGGALDARSAVTRIRGLERQLEARARAAHRIFGPRPASALASPKPVAFKR